MVTESEILPYYAEIIDFLNRDASRLLPDLKAAKDHGDSGVLDGPKICIKTTKTAFKSSYRAAVEEIQSMVGGPRVKDVSWIILHDAEENYWGDFAMAKIIVE